MGFYWSARSIPELRDFSAAERKLIVQEAFRTLRISFWSALLVIGFMAIAVATGLIVGINFDKKAGFIVALPFCLFVKPMLLNLALPRIRELASENKPNET
jgi:hypothetical protein